jgi:hypothetical protein
MNGKKPAKAEHNNPPPPLPAAKRTCCSVMTVHMQGTDLVPIEQEKLNKKSFLAAPRALLDKEGFLKMEEQLTAESLYTVYKLIFDRYSTRLPSDTHKVMLAFKAFLGVFTAEKNMEKAPDMEEHARRISNKVEEAIDRGITKLSKAIETSLTGQKDLQESSKKMEESTAAIHKALEQVNKNLTVVTDSSNKLTNKVSSYKEALLVAPKPAQQASSGMHMGNLESNPRITRDINLQGLPSSSRHLQQGHCKLEPQGAKKQLQCPDQRRAHGTAIKCECATHH